MNNGIAKVVQWAVTLAVPVFLGFTLITLVIGPAYPRYEYAKDDFPADVGGLTQEQRLDLALVAVAFLERREPAEAVIFMLGEQTLPGTDVPLYSADELGHMVDVKNVTDIIRTLGVVAAIVVAAGMGVLVVQPSTRQKGFLAIRNGGIVTSVVLVGIGLFILAAWETFFVQFHELLFPQGNWTFSFSSGLIRLFPERFWFDVGIIISGGTLLLGVLFAAVGWLLLRLRDRQAVEQQAGGAVKPPITR